MKCLKTSFLIISVEERKKREWDLFCVRSIAHTLRRQKRKNVSKNAVFLLLFLLMLLLHLTSLSLVRFLYLTLTLAFSLSLFVYLTLSLSLSHSHSHSPFSPFVLSFEEGPRTKDAVQARYVFQKEAFEAKIFERWKKTLSRQCSKLWREISFVLIGSSSVSIVMQIRRILYLVRVCVCLCVCVAHDSIPSSSWNVYRDGPKKWHTKSTREGTEKRTLKEGK